MSGRRGRRVQNMERPIPGCLGRMVNLFDLGAAGVGQNKMLLDRPHSDASSLSRSQSDVARILSPPFEDRIEDKVIVSEVRSTSKGFNSTPMKKLIAQEMSKEVDYRLSPTNVVAKLMGLDSLPQPQPDVAARRSNSKGRSRRSLSNEAIPTRCWEQDYGLSNKRIQSEAHGCQGHPGYKDLYEIWQQRQKSNYARDCSPRKGRHNENISEEKVTLVRQKFMEAKRLVTDEKLRQSKEFDEAMEVLSSNKELFLRFLKKSNSSFSQHLHDFQSIPPPPETKRITILRPSKIADGEKLELQGKEIDKQMEKTAHMVQGTCCNDINPEYSLPFINQNVEEYPPQSTRIVVLKPSPGNAHGGKALASSSPSSPSVLRGEDYYVEEDDVEAREVAKKIAQHMRENFVGLQRDETVVSSIFSNGYIGDDSSFNESENDYAVENHSDSEILSPASRQSWDYVNRLDSPFSSLSFSRASCSPESSVCREAKKRLSERWALMASHGNFKEQKHIQKNSSTLGEMLALSDIKKPVNSNEGESSHKEQQPRASTSSLSGNFNKEEGISDSPKSLLRSKSVPVSSTVYETGLNVKVADPKDNQDEVPKELTKSKSMKLSFKGKVSRFLFSRNKKSEKEKSAASQSEDESQVATPETFGSPLGTIPAQATDGASLSYKDGHLQEQFLIGGGQVQNITSLEVGLSVEKPTIRGSASENQDQPSPISVLEPPFKEDDSIVLDSSNPIKPLCQGPGMSLKANLIDKSPPIGSVARTLSWDESCTETASLYSTKPSIAFPAAREEKDWHFLVNALFSAAGLNNEAKPDSLLAKWHSSESPLDPSLRNKYANDLDEKEPIHEARRRQRRSSRKLVFDLVNALLMETTPSHHGLDRSIRTLSHNRATLEDYLWTRMKEWFSDDSKSDGGDKDSLVVERVVRQEVAGDGWDENMRLEMDCMGKDIEGKLLEELVEEAVTDLAGGV